MELTDKVAFITGAASGMGAATAHRLAELGATVVVADIDADGAARVAGELPGPGRHRSVALDVRDAAEWARVLEGLVADLGRLDIVHLNAGIMSRPPGAPIDEPMGALTEAAYRRVMGVNVDGVVLGVLAALPHLEDNGGDIVVTASMAGLVPLEIDPFYAMSKHALVGFVRSLASLQARGIRVNAVCPGGIDTAIVPDAIRAAGTALSPPSYIADVVVQILESGEGGRAWLALGDAHGAWVVEPPSMRRDVAG